jgi:hypothetical protein
MLVRLYVLHLKCFFFFQIIFSAIISATHFFPRTLFQSKKTIDLTCSDLLYYCTTVITLQTVLLQAVCAVGSVCSCTLLLNDGSPLVNGTGLQKMLSERVLHIDLNL